MNHLQYNDSTYWINYTHHPKLQRNVIADAKEKVLKMQPVSYLKDNCFKTGAGEGR